jgi:arylsulfatase A-like enzyme
MGAVFPQPAGAESPGSFRRPPNLVLVVADDLGYGELGCYGQNMIRTPHLDRMAAEGVRCTGYYAGGPICATSRCTLLTGLHVGRCRVRENPPFGPGTDLPLLPEDVTFGEVLQAAGYRTGLIGKWGFGPDQAGQPSHPNDQGFEEFFGYLTHRHAQEYYPTHLWQDSTRLEFPENANGNQVTYAPDLCAERALDFIERHQEGPFLLVFASILPHAPHHVPSLAPYENEPWPDNSKAHAAQVTRLDSYVGQILARLTELGIADDTIVFFTSDNGPHEAGSPPLDPYFFDANGPLRGIKRNLYEGGIRAPMIAWSPARLLLRAGTVSSHPWASWDVLPTLADLAGTTVPEGLSMRPLLTGFPWQRPPTHEYLFWSRIREPTSQRANVEDNGRGLSAADAVRFGRWKSVRFAPTDDRSAPDEQWALELYDLRADPGETTDVSERYPRVAAQALRYMKEAWVEPL